MSDEHGLAVGALVGPHVLVEVDEERRIGVELALQGSGGDLLVQGVEPQESGGVRGANGSGTALDHIAFGCSDLEEMLGRLGAIGVAHGVQVQAVTGQTLVRLEDPCGLRVELVFEPADRQVSMQRCWGA